MELPDNYQMIKTLGEGTFGKCYLIMDSETSKYCVLKKIDIKGMTESQKQDTMKEARIMQALDHASIIKLVNAFKSRGGYLNIVMQYADGGDLSTEIKHMKSAGKHFPEEQILEWFTEMCLALKHVHERRIIHRDLKCENIFLTKKKMIKLGDFGIAKNLKQSIEKLKSVVGTPYYMSPEICENRDYSFKTDVWSLGVVMYELCALKPPFEANGLGALALKILKGKYQSLQHYSAQLRSIIAEMLTVNPANRPSVSDLLNKPLIKKRIASYMSKVRSNKQLHVAEPLVEGHHHIYASSPSITNNSKMKQEESKINSNRVGPPLYNNLFSPQANQQVLLFAANTPQNKNNGIFNVKLKQGSGSSQKQYSQVGGVQFPQQPTEEKQKGKKLLRNREYSEPNLAQRVGSTDRIDKSKKYSHQNPGGVVPSGFEKKKSAREDQYHIRAPPHPRKLIQEGSKTNILTLLQEVKEQRDGVKQQKNQVHNLDKQLTSRYDSDSAGSYLRNFKLEQLNDVMNGGSDEPDPVKQLEMKQSLYLIQQKYKQRGEQEVEFMYQTQQDTLKSMLEAKLGKEKFKTLLGVVKDSMGFPTDSQLSFLETTEKEAVGLCCIYYYYTNFC